MSKTYTYTAMNLAIALQGAQSKGDNAGKPYAMGTFTTMVTPKNATEKTEVKKGFKAFDETTKKNKVELTPASRIIELVAAGHTELVLTGSFVKGRARNADDASAGNFSDFHVKFVATKEEHEAFVASQKAKREAAAAA